MKRSWLLLLLVALSACPQGADIIFGFDVRLPIDEVAAPVDHDPLLGGDRLTLRVYRGDTPMLVATQDVPLPAVSFWLEPLPLGDDFVIETRVFHGDVLLSRGRSFPFDVGPDGVTAPGAGDLFLGTLGRFGRRVEPGLPSPPVAISPTRDGALGGLADGRIFLFRPMSAVPLEIIDVGLPAGAAFVGCGGSRLYAFDPTRAALSLYAADGLLEASIGDGPLAAHGPGVALASDAGGERLLLVGGGPSGFGRAVTLVTRTADGLEARALDLLPDPHGDAMATWVAGHTPHEARVLVFGDEDEAVHIIDPSSGVIHSVPTPPGVEGAVALGVFEGQVLLVGGSAHSDVRLLILELEPTPTLVAASPSSPALSAHRFGPRLIPAQDGVVLVVGGVDGNGLPIPYGELIDLRVFPGVTVASGELPSEVVDPRGARLADGAVWVFAEHAIYGYVPPVE